MIRLFKEGKVSLNDVIKAAYAISEDVVRYLFFAYK